MNFSTSLISNNRHRKFFWWHCLLEMNQSESSVFWKWSVYHFLKTLIIIWKMSIKKHMIFLELLYKKKEKIRIDFLIDETDVDSYFFHNCLDVYVVRNRVLRLSKGLFREAYSIKVFTFDPTYCVSKLQFYGWITPHKERIFVYSENLKLIKKSYDIIRKSYENLFLSPTQYPNL